MPIDFIEGLPKNDKKSFSSIEKKLQLTLSVYLSVCGNAFEARVSGADLAGRAGLDRKGDSKGASNCIIEIL